MEYLALAIILPVACVFFLIIFSSNAARSADAAPFLLATVFLAILPLGATMSFIAWDQVLRQVTQYAVTNKRIVVSALLFWRFERSLLLPDIVELGIQEGRNKRGTIRFRPAYDWFMRNTSLLNLVGIPRFELEAIDEAQSVYAIILKAKSQATASAPQAA
jgi:hypothetical protein